MRLTWTRVMREVIQALAKAIEDIQSMKQRSQENLESLRQSETFECLASGLDEQTTSVEICAEGLASLQENHHAFESLLTGHKKIEPGIGVGSIVVVELQDGAKRQLLIGAHPSSATSEIMTSAGRIELVSHESPIIKAIIDQSLQPGANFQVNQKIRCTFVANYRGD